MLKRTGRLLLALLLTSNPANAFEVVKSSDATTVGSAVVVVAGDDTFAITEIPGNASDIKGHKTIPDQFAKSNISSGLPASEEEILFALEEYFRKTAINFESIKLRNINVGQPQYVTWCDRYDFFMCSNTQIRAGTWVDFEVNGGNRSGGLTGFQRRFILVRKSKTIK